MIVELKDVDYIKGLTPTPEHSTNDIWIPMTTTYGGAKA